MILEMFSLLFECVALLVWSFDEFFIPVECPFPLLDFFFLFQPMECIDGLLNVVLNDELGLGHDFMLVFENSSIWFLPHIA
jgi:hypothetical protein